MKTSSLIQTAADTVKAGGLIAYPTEAVLGLGCDPFNQDAVSRLLALKQRPVNKGLILVASSWEQLTNLLLPVSAAQLQQMQASWPGATTWLVPCKAGTPKWITGDSDCLAVRIPGHPVARDICAAVGGPIVSTSANLSGQEAARTVNALPLSLTDKINYVFPQNAGGAAAPSKIIDLLTGTAFR